MSNSEKRVTVSIPRGTERGDPNVTVIVNGKSFILPKGKKSDVPPCVVEELERSERAKDRFYQTSEELQKASKKTT